MHVRLQRAEHAELSAEAARRGVTVRALVRERLTPRADQHAAQHGRAELIRLVTQISQHGREALELALELGWGRPDGARRIEVLAAALAAAYEAGRRAAAPARDEERRRG